MNYKKHIKENKKLIIALVVIILFLISIVAYNLVQNHNYFLKLNAQMEELYIKPYDENNLLIKKQTLENMENKIINDIKEFDVWYSENIKLNKENETQKETITNSNKKAEQKLDELRALYLKDVTTKNDKLKDAIKSKLNVNVKYVDEEKTKYTNYKKEFDNIKYEDDLKISIDNYQKLLTLKTNIIKNLDVAQKRIAEEKRIKAEQEAQQRAEQEAQKVIPEADPEPQNNNSNSGSSSSSNSNSSTPSGNFDRGYATGIFNAINAYRASRGLPAYSYNSSKQSCVDSEAKAFAANGNMHNYVCQPFGAENAGLTYDGYYSPSAMVDLWKQDEPHHRPLVSTSYTSCAVSAYKSGGYLYIEAIFW